MAAPVLAEDRRTFKTPPPHLCPILQTRRDCFLFVQDQPWPRNTPPSFPPPPPFPFPAWPRIELTVPPAKQADWKEAKTRPRTRAAGGAGFMLEREASAGPAPWRCAECWGHVPACVLSGRSLKSRPSEVNFYSVFGKRKRVEQRKFSCHTFLLPL